MNGESDGYAAAYGRRMSSSVGAPVAVERDRTAYMAYLETQMKRFNDTATDVRDLREEVVAVRALAVAATSLVPS